MERENVLIVGAGPVGLVTALGLARSGIGVTVLEREGGIGRAPRAMVDFYSVLPGFDALGFGDDVRARGVKGEKLSHLVHATGERITFELDALTGHVPYPFNVHMGQDKLSEILLEHLATYTQVKILRNTRAVALVQDASGVTVDVETADGPGRLRTGWVVGADGSNSAVRRSLGLEFQGITWPERFVATNVVYDFEALGYADANMVIDPELGAIVARIDNTGLWRCTYSESSYLPEEGIADRMKTYFAALLPERDQPEVVSWSPYRMHQRTSETLRLGRVVLAGDAAHVTNPTGGLGLTSGFYDAFVLHEALAAIIHGDANSSVLDDYSEQRRRSFLEGASPAASELKRLVYHSHDPRQLARDLEGLRAVAGDPAKTRAQLAFVANLATPSLLQAPSALIGEQL